MKVNKYNLEIDKNRIPLLVEEDSYDFDESENLSNPDIVLNMLNKCFRLGYLAEEHLCLIALDCKLTPLAVFEISHGTTSYCTADSSDIFKRALMVGATRIILAHNHPSGILTPSENDKATYERLKEIALIMGINIEDFLIIHKQNLLSLRRENLK